MARKRKSLRVVRDRIKPLLVSITFAMIGKSLMTNGFETASWVFMGIALFFLGLRNICRIKPVKNRCHIGWHLYDIPLWVSRFALSDIRAVRVVHKIHRNKYTQGKSVENPDHHYLIYLEGILSSPIQLIRNNKRAARKLGERLAISIHCPLYDASYGAVIKREPEEVDMSLGERLHHRGHQAEYPGPPSNSKLKILSRGNETQLQFPAHRLPMFVLWIFLLIIAPLVVVLWMANTPETLGILGFIGFITAVILLAYVNSAQPGYLWLSAEELRTQKLPFGGRIRMHELEEIILKNSDIMLVSDKKSIAIPYDFSDKAEAAYVKQLIEYVAFRSASREPMNRK